MFGHHAGRSLSNTLGAFIEPILMYHQVITVNALPPAVVAGQTNCEASNCESFMDMSRELS